MVMLGAPSEQDGYIYGTPQTTPLPYATLRGLTLEPFKRSLLEALQQYLGDALEAADNNVELDGPIGLILPKSFKFATLANMQLIQEWPALVVLGLGLDAVAGTGQQKQSGKYRGRVGVVAMLQDQDDARLAIMLDRYGDAIVRALMQQDSYSGWMIDADSLTIVTSEQPKTNANARGAGVFFEGYTYG